jgi:glycine betaine catabolism B
MLAAILLSPAFVFGQTTPDDHTKHHPPAAATPTPGQNPANSNTGMGGMMDEMMKRMGAPPPKELYPSLMELPDLPPEKRAEVERLARERIGEGNALINAAREKMADPNAAQDPEAMREAAAQMRRGLALYESGLAARQALAGGQDDRAAALQWFKREMNLLPAAPAETPHGLFGLSWFHYVTMFVITAFAAAMVWMYFHKMRRAEALLARLSGGQTLAAGASASATSPHATAASNAAALSSGLQPVSPEIAPSRPNSWSGTLRVARIFQETPSVKTFRLVDPSGGRLPFNYLPGQFITVTVFPDGLPVKRSYTIASSPTNRDSCEITVKQEEQGIVSRHLHERVHEGELLQLTGPSGKFTFTGEESESVVLIAGGVGVTPMMSVVRYLTDRSWPGDIFFIYGSRTEGDIIYREEIEYLQKRHPNLRVTLVAEEADPSTWKHATGLMTKELIASAVPDIASRRVHICGPKPMMDAVKLMLAELGVPAENVRTEVFAALPKPQAPRPLPDGAAPVTAVVRFVRSNKTAMLPPDKTVLEASEDVGVNIDYSCRVGTCGVCVTKLLSGSVTMQVQDALTEEDKARNMILACQAKATNDVSVDA